jgi:hypothetical protein
MTDGQLFTSNTFHGNRRMTLFPHRVARLTRGAALTLLNVVVAIATTSPARADEFIDRVNAQFANVKPDKRSDLILLPLLGKMDAPPKPVTDADPWLLIVPTQAAWPEVVAWLEAPNQKALIEALPKITDAKDARDLMVFAQPYGVEGVSPDLIQSGMYSELGDPPMLAGTNQLFLPALGRFHRLIQLEAIRRNEAGDTIGAIDLLVRQAIFGRQLSERPFGRETLIGYTMMHESMSRVRDVAHMDFRGKKNLQTAAQLARIPEIIDRLEEDKGVLGLDRLPFPVAHRVAADQLVDRVMTPRQGPNKDTFPTTLARIRTADRPLRLFGEAGRWQTVMPRHRNTFDTVDQVKKVFDDWQARWRLEPTDPRMLQPFVYESMDRAGFAVVEASTFNLGMLFPIRQYIRTEVGGTRHTLALLAFFYTNKGWPPQIQSVRPKFIKAITADPYNPNRARGQQPPFEFFVPVRDAVVNNPRDEKKPHEMALFVPDGSNFTVRLREDTFVLYSLGADGGKNWAERIQNDWNVIKGSDLLLWPPVTSLWRQHLSETGKLK